MAIIDGINVSIYECNQCGSKELWLFRGEKGEGYKISCAKCWKEQRELIDELGLSYLWRHKEAQDAERYGGIDRERTQ